MNIVYVENTEVTFDSIENGQCFITNNKIYMKIYHSYPNIELNAINTENGITLYFDDDYVVTPVYAELYITGYNKNTQPIHAKWIEHPHERGSNWEFSTYECSNCHNCVDDDSDYCPNCGAKMDKV